MFHLPDDTLVIGESELGMAAFELYLFCGDPAGAVRARAAGIDGIVIDWESRGKRARQASADTEINRDTPLDLRAVRAATDARILCRLNQPGPLTPVEVEEAVEDGASEVLIPMVRGPDEVESALAASSGRCGVGIMVETEDAVANAAELGRLPISRAYVGLNDLAIERGADSIFEAVTDGTVARVREAFEAPFGFAGLTRPALGHPVPCRLLIAEMARLRCSFSFLRRSYRRDVPPGEQPEAVAEIREALALAERRGAEQVESDLAELTRLVGVPA